MDITKTKVPEDVTKHLEFIQSVVARMANHSFLLKGWTITLTAAIFGLAAKGTNPTFVLIAFFPAAAFWGLDAYYLRRERLFRKLYDDVRRSKKDGVQTVEPFSMDTSRYEADVPSVWRTMWCGAIVWLHGIVLLAIVLVFGILQQTH
ncbi:MAG TPA: hypothetical protein VN577_04325 [Terriglobales bacterium]|nr:hypothetical protein [Terriglobales bacterium]